MKAYYQKKMAQEGHEFEGKLKALMDEFGYDFTLCIKPPEGNRRGAMIVQMEMSDLWPVLLMMISSVNKMVPEDDRDAFFYSFVAFVSTVSDVCFPSVDARIIHLPDQDEEGDKDAD